MLRIEDEINELESKKEDLESEIEDINAHLEELYGLRNEENERDSSIFENAMNLFVERGY